MDVEPQVIMSDVYNAGSPPISAAGHAEARLIERLKACQKLAVELARPEFEQFIHGLDEQLVQAAALAKTNQAQTDCFAMQRQLRQEAPVFIQTFLAALAEGFIRFKKQELHTTTGEEKFQGDMLSLVDNDDLEETIAIASITQRAENNLAELLWGLNQRLAVVNGGRKVLDRTNPLGPIQYCQALRRALDVVTFDTKSRIMAYKLFEQRVIPHLGAVLEAVNGYLREEGILPNLRYSPAATERAPTPAPVDPLGGWEDVPDAAPAPSLIPVPDPALPSAQYQGRLVEAIRTLQGRIAHVGGDAGAGYAPAQVGQGFGGRAPADFAGAGIPGFSGHGSVYPDHSYGGQGYGGHHHSASGGGAHQPLVYSNQQVLQALGGLQQQALQVAGDGRDSPAQPLPAQPVARLSQQLLEALRADTGAGPGAMADTEMHTIDLVGMLFEYMLSDDNLPDSVKALLSYLHTPFLKIAFIDKDFFEQAEHPARLLLNALAEAGVKWVGNDGSDQFDIYSKIKATVSRVLEAFSNDVRLFAELLLEFSSYTRNIQRRQELVERRAMEKVQGEEKLREVKQQVNRVVRTRTDGRELPSAILLLLLQPWSDFLAFVLLRYGDQSERWQRAVRVIDEVLWSVEPKVLPQDKLQQEEMQAGLLTHIEAGFETIGYDQAKGKKLLEAIASLQKMALKSRQIEAAPQPMRAKLESLAAEKAGEATGEQGEVTPQEVQMVEKLKLIEFGTWFEFGGGRRLKVAWYNSKTSHYMLVDQMGKKVAMKSGVELARAMLGGQARVIAGSTKPFFERALENIFHSLNKKAGTLASGDTHEQ